MVWRRSATGCAGIWRPVRTSPPPEVITRYFRRLYGANVREKTDRLDKNRILPLIDHREGDEAYIPYREIAERFRYIDQRDQKRILVPNEENRELCEQLRKGIVHRKLLRTLTKDMVTLYTWEYDALRDKGVLTPTCCEIAILEDDYHTPRYYDPECGIVFDREAEALFCEA